MTGQALNDMAQVFADQAHSHVPWYLVVIRDATSANPVAEALREHGLIIYAIGVRDADITELQQITKDKMFFMHEFDSLKAIQQEVIQDICSTERCNIDLSVGIGISTPMRQVLQNLQVSLPELMRQLVSLSNISCSVPGPVSTMFHHLVPGSNGQLIFDSGFEKYSEEVIQKLLIHQTAHSSHMDMEFLLFLGDNAVHLFSAEVKEWSQNIGGRPADHLGSQEETTGLHQQWLYGMALSAVSPLGNRGYERAVVALCGSTYLLHFHLVGLKGASLFHREKEAPGVLLGSKTRTDAQVRGDLRVIMESQGHLEKKDMGKTGSILEWIVTSKALREKKEGVAISCGTSIAEKQCPTMVLLMHWSIITTTPPPLPPLHHHHHHHYITTTTAAATTTATTTIITTPPPQPPPPSPPPPPTPPPHHHHNHHHHHHRHCHHRHQKPPPSPPPPPPPPPHS
ncbi:Collagen Alpha-6(Vi) Chain [Manis pentadactyla]|nr:Collagen Alpha-6(Vi) Chain [Manis pentadactyla]